jgi:hypothetical protein
MKRPLPRKLPALADFATRKLFASGDREAWGVVTGWQRQRLVTVQPISAHHAWVALTDAGRDRVAAEPPSHRPLERV